MSQLFYNLGRRAGVPDPLDKRVARAVADAVMQAARETGVARA